MAREDFLGPMFDESERAFNRIWGNEQEETTIEDNVNTEVAEEEPQPINYASLGASKRKTADREDELNFEAPLSKKPLQLQKDNKKSAIVDNGLPSPIETDSDATKKEKLHPPSKKARTNPKPVYIQREVIDTRLQPSDWYASINLNAEPHRGDVATLKYVLDLTENCVSAHLRNDNMSTVFSALREQLHKMPFFGFLNPQNIKKSKVLEENRLSRIFSGADAHIFPYDIQADARALWHRWMNGDISPDLIRGVELIKRVKDGGARNISYKLDPKAPRTNPPNVFGDNGLVNGEWWPLRICALRDGAHGAMEAGIHGNLKGVGDKGAYSIVIADGGYKDEDNGEKIKYCSTPSQQPSANPTPTEGTRLLIASLASHTPIRVLRAVKRNSPWAPRSGIRYDGLYFIVSKETLDEKTAFMRFELQRMPGQAPIRCEAAGEARRPTVQEESEMARVRALWN